jgi:hypothetical protein
MGAEARGKGVNVLLGPTVGKVYLCSHCALLQVYIICADLSRPNWQKTTRRSQLGRIRCWYVLIKRGGIYKNLIWLDPVLQAKGGAQTITGIQANGVIATIKHFIGNEQEAYRMDIVPHGLMRALSSNIDDR